MMFFSPERVRQDFTVLSKEIIYLDNACMSLKPKQVIDAMRNYYDNFPACCGRSAHSFAQKVGTEIDKARKQVSNFVNGDVIFTRNTTEGINLVANAIKEMDKVVITGKEHNSNLIPWLNKKTELTIVKPKEDNTFEIEDFEKAVTEETKLVSIVHTSNLDGVSTPVKEICKIAHEKGALCMVDGAQSTPHKEIDVKNLGVDFFSFSGHKMCGPTGTGALYIKNPDELQQFMTGGDTVIDSTYESFTPEKSPMKFEAGLQDYAGIIGFGEACKYLKRIGLNTISKHETKLNSIITDELDVNLIGPIDASKRSGIFSFNIKGMDPHNIAGILDSSSKIMIRSGAHCVHSWFNEKKMNGSARASMYFYNTQDEVQRFCEEIKKIQKLTI